MAICIALRTLMSVKGALSNLGHSVKVGGSGVIFCNISGFVFRIFSASKGEIPSMTSIFPADTAFNASTLSGIIRYLTVSM